MENRVNIIHYCSSDKSKWWGEGEWVNEPDEVTFTHQGINCKILRMVFPLPDDPPHVFGGHLCGYVEIPKDHPFYGKHYDEINIDVHCGLTYAKFTGNEYWIGFDCAHSSDYLPSLEFIRKTSECIKKVREQFPIPEEYKDSPLFNPTYKNIDFCISECISMAEQLKDFENV